MTSLIVRFIVPVLPLAIGLGAVACGSDGGGSSSSGGSGGEGGAGAAAGATSTGGATGTTGGATAGGAGGDGPVFDAGSDPARNRVQPGVACERVATIQCAGEQFCCDNPGRTLEACKTAQLAACADVYLDEVSENPISGYSVDAAEDAFTEFERLASECDPEIASWSLSPDGLRGVTQGTVAANGDCTPLNILDVAVVAAHLASCQNPGTHACLPGTVSWTCAPRQQADGPCFTDVNCAEGLYCNNNLNAPLVTGAQCKARKANGTACTYGNECESLSCEGGSCVTATDQTAYCIAE